MPRSIHRVDGTQAAIVTALRKAGVAVESLSSVGGGIPDLLCAVRSYTCLVECKVPRGRVRKSQEDFRARWPGDIHVVTSGEEAVLAVIAGARHVFERSA